MSHSLSVYHDHFEKKILSDSQNFYLLWAKDASSTGALGSYLQRCYNLMKEEGERCDLLKLPDTTTGKLRLYLDDILVDDNQERLLRGDEIFTLLDENNIEALAQLFNLLRKRKLEIKLEVPFKNFVQKTGSSIVFDENRQAEMVPRLLKFKKSLDDTLHLAFADDSELGQAMRGAFDAFMNETKKSSMAWDTDNSLVGEMVAKYLDMILKGGVKSLVTVSSKTSQIPIQDDEAPSEDEDATINQQLDQVLELFRFLHGKQVFEAFYKRDLARRLLLQRSASADAEKGMVNRLRTGKLFFSMSVARLNILQNVVPVLRTI